ncbi:hypothetical protein ACFL56_00590 [Candidatus Margulisiibacteriota bacterium]
MFFKSIFYTNEDAKPARKRKTAKPFFVDHDMRMNRLEDLRKKNVTIQLRINRDFHVDLPERISDGNALVEALTGVSYVKLEARVYVQNHTSMKAYVPQVDSFATSIFLKYLKIPEEQLRVAAVSTKFESGFYRVYFQLPLSSEIRQKIRDGDVSLWALLEYEPGKRVRVR